MWAVLKAEREAGGAGGLRLSSEGRWRRGGLERLGGDEFNIGGEVPEGGVTGEELVYLLEGTECRVVDDVFWKELAIPDVAKLEAGRFEKSVDALPGVEAVMIFISTGARDFLGPREPGGEIEAEKEAARLQDPRYLCDGCSVIWYVFKHSEANNDIEGRVGIRQLIGVGEGGDGYLEALEDGGLLAKGRIVLVQLDIAGFEAAGGEIAEEFADVSFAAAPVKDGELIERPPEMALGEGFDVVGEVDVGILPGRVLEKMMGRERRGCGSNLLVQRPMTGEEILAKATKVGVSKGIHDQWLNKGLDYLVLVSSPKVLKEMSIAIPHQAEGR